MSVDARAGGGLERTLPREYYLSPELFAREKERIFCREWFCVGPRGGAGRAGRLRGEGRGGREHPARADARGPARRRTTTSAATAARSSCPTAAPAASPAASAAPTTPGPTPSTASSAPRRFSRRPTASPSGQLSLHPVGVDAWGGFVFVHLTPADAGRAATRSRRSSAAVPERLRRYPLAELRVAQRIVYEVAAPTGR